MICGCEQVRVYRFAGLHWLGMPYPIRLAAWAVFTLRGGREWPLRFCRSRWIGCGCIKPLADAWGSLAWRVARWR